MESRCKVSTAQKIREVCEQGHDPQWTVKGREGVRVMTSEALVSSRPGTPVRGTRSLAGVMTAPFWGWGGGVQWELSWGPGSKVPRSMFVLYPEDGEKLLTFGSEVANEKV